MRRVRPIRVLLMLFWCGLFLGIELWTQLWFYIHFIFVLHFLFLYIVSQCPHLSEAIWLISNANRLIGFSLIWTLWSKCIVLTLHMFYLFHLSIYLLCVIFALVCCCCCCCCLLIILIHFIVVVFLFNIYSSWMKLHATFLVYFVHYWF